MKSFIEKTNLECWSKALSEKPGATAIMNALNGTSLKQIAYNPNAKRDNIAVFSNEIKTGPIQHQHKSGRCWLFAGMNFLRQKAVTNPKNDFKDIVFSGSYMVFWHNMEKANYFMEMIIDTKDDSLDDRTVRWILQNPVCDGGQWGMFNGLVKKYGVVPKEAMPENQQSDNTGEMNGRVATKLRQSAAKLRDMAAKGASVEELRAEKEKILSDFYTLYSLSLGEPPKVFDYEYYDKDGNYKRIENITPQDFYAQYVDVELDDYVCLVNAPMYDKKMNELYTVKYLGNMWEGERIIYLNVEIDEMKKYVLAQLEAGETVWFGSDCIKQSDRPTGLFVHNLFDYESVYLTDFSMTKGERLDYNDSFPNHAMVFTGVNLADGVPNRWKVENSWGEDLGAKGYFVMSDGWFNEFVYQVIINKKYLPEDVQKKFEGEPVVLAPWDPLGALA